MAWKSTNVINSSLNLPGYQFLPYVILYFFLNNFLLPQGLLFTTLLAPVFLYFLYKKGKLRNWLAWSLLFLLPVPFHLFQGVDVRSYFISTLLIFTAWLFFFTALHGIRTIRGYLPEFFMKVMVLNSVLVVIALLFLPFPSMRDLFWHSAPISEGIGPFPRLKLLAYEASHYALLLAPVFLYFILKVVTGRSRHPLLVSAAVLIPLLLSLSFGVLGAMAAALIIAFFLYIKDLPARSRRNFIYSLSLAVLAAAVLAAIWPSNPVFVRLENIFSGTDTSARGRLVTSFTFAMDLAVRHNLWMGAGPGQIKILAHDLIVNFYQYTGKYAEIVRIPNSMGEMLATYGIYGFILKISLELYFFFLLKIWKNLFSLTLFLFIFIYQFTGSFIVNAAELGIWALVYASRISIFDIKSLKNTDL